MSEPLKLWSGLINQIGKNEMLDYIYKEICRLVELYEQNKCSDIAARYLQMMYKVDLVSMGEMR